MPVSARQALQTEQQRVPLSGRELQQEPPLPVRVQVCSLET